MSLLNKKLTVIKVAGIPKKATLFDNTKVYRNDIIAVELEGKPHHVKTAAYDNHFIYETPVHILGWSPMCTCGGMAGIVGYNMYKGDASPTVGSDLVSGELAVCLFHAQNGKHADDSS